MTLLLQTNIMIGEQYCSFKKVQNQIIWKLYENYRIELDHQLNDENALIIFMQETIIAYYIINKK